jgi:alcohol dehydrogenase class IV
VNDSPPPADPASPAGARPLSDRERDFRWRDGERLVRFARGAVHEAPTLLAERGFEGYALLSTRRALATIAGADGLARAATAVLDVPPGPVPDASAAVRGEVRGRPLVALGGGRVIDSAKAIGAADGLRCAAVPTTLSGAEMTTIHRLPAGVEAPHGGLLRAALVVADPQAMASQPPRAQAASAMNALAHGAEALYGPGANPVAELAALRGAALLAGGLEAAGEEAERVALGAVLCAFALDGAGLGLHHALCQTIVRLLGTPHAETNAVMLPHVLRWVAPHAPRELGGLAQALGAPAADGRGAARRAAELAARSGVTRLSKLGVQAAELDEVLPAVLSRPELGETPGRPGREQVGELLARAL